MVKEWHLEMWEILNLALWNPEEILLEGVKANSVLGNISLIIANGIYVTTGPEFPMWNNPIV